MSRRVFSQLTRSAAVCCLLTTAAAAAAAAATATAAAAAAAAAGAAGATEPGRLQCPCAYLERGGFWDSPTAASLGVSDRVYRERRCSCRHEANCDWSWRDTDKSLTMAWLGSHDIGDSEIQLQFCAPVQLPGAPLCLDNDSVAFTLRQSGWWIDLHETRCRCGPGGSPANIRGFRYSRPLPQGERLHDQTVEFACGRMVECGSADQPCYLESLNQLGQRVSGRVRCTCPAGSHCPVYTGLGARIITPSAELSNGTDSEGNEGEGERPRIELLCRPDP